MRWSRLQRELYKLTKDGLDFHIHCARYPMESRRGSTDLPRYWITLGKDIIFDYPKQFVDEKGFLVNIARYNAVYPYSNEISDISVLIREYIDTPETEIFHKSFDNDHWDLIDIFRAADRRIGRQRLELLKDQTKNEAVKKVIVTRLENQD